MKKFQRRADNRLKALTGVWMVEVEDPRVE